MCDYLFDVPPAPGRRIEVVPGIDWICMPLPFALDHVNCWWLHDGDDNCLIDTGVASNKTRNLWHQVLGEHEYPEAVLATHFHPDHIGLAGWFAAHGSYLLGNEIEIATARKWWQLDATSYSAHYVDWYAEHGVGGEALSRVRGFGNAYATIVDEPPAHWRLLNEGDVLDLCGRRFEVLLGKGHAPAMLMLYAEEDHLLIAADQVLPGISPNVSLMPGVADENPLGSFLDSLNALRRLPEDTRVLPSHGRPFTGLHARIDQLIVHHEQRCAQLLEATQEAQAASDLFGVLFNRELNAQQMSFALGETLAHLRLLERQGKMRQESVDAAGRKLFIRL